MPPELVAPINTEGALLQRAPFFVGAPADRPPDAPSLFSFGFRANGRPLLIPFKETNREAEQALIITHAGVIRALFAHILKLPTANAFQFRVDVGSVHKLQHLDNYTYINYINL